MYARREFGLGRIYDLAWNNRDLATKHTLQQWAQQYENDFFSLADWERGRYFSGRFEGPLTFNPVGNQKYNIKGRFIELPGLALFATPTNYSRDGIFLEERNGFGEDLVKLAGAGWSFQSAVAAHGGANYVSGNTNDTAEWIYFGYSFRYWSRTEPDVGIVEVSCTRVRDGFAIVPAHNVDLYTSGFLKFPGGLRQPLGSSFSADVYRVKLRVTGHQKCLILLQHYLRGRNRGDAVRTLPAGMAAGAREGRPLDASRAPDRCTACGRHDVFLVELRGAIPFSDHRHAAAL